MHAADQLYVTIFLAVQNCPPMHGDSFGICSTSIATALGYAIVRQRGALLLPLASGIVRLELGGDSFAGPNAISFKRINLLSR